jgi:hypothetical protein
VEGPTGTARAVRRKPHAIPGFFRDFDFIVCNPYTHSGDEVRSLQVYDVQSALKRCFPHPAIEGQHVSRRAGERQREV